MRLTLQPGGSADARVDDVALRRDGRSRARDGGSEIRHYARTSAARIEDFRLVPGNRTAAVVGPVSRSVVSRECVAPAGCKQRSKTFCRARVKETRGLLAQNCMFLLP